MRVLLVDDHELFVDALRYLLSASGFEVVGTAGDGMEALEQARALQPDLILLDISLPGYDGLAAVRLIKAEMPSMKIVMLTASNDDAKLFEAIKSGASGYLLKSTRSADLVRRLALMENGEPPLSPGLAAKLIEEFARQANLAAPDKTQDASAELSPRQTQVLMLVARGMTYRQVADLLYLSESAVRYHISAIMERLHLANRAQIIAYAARLGLSGAASAPPSDD